MSSSKKMLINTDHPEECRVVLLENGKLEKLVIEHSTRQNIKGNVYKGVITRVEPAFEAAFVDFGGNKFGFMPFKDVRKESHLKTREKKAKVRIQDVLVRGQKILVQVVKEERDSKGPTLTNFLTIPGRFLVLMGGNVSGGVSRKIEDESERKKLKDIVKGFKLSQGMGVIIRTAGMGRTKVELQKDLQMLMKIWEKIEKKDHEKTEPPFLVYQVPNMVERTVRDHFTTDTSEIVVDNEQAYKTLQDFFKLVMPRMRNRVKFYNEPKPLFSQYNIEAQIEAIYNRRVELPSGGSLVFDVGEALVAIDVNSGKTTGASELEETALKTNLEAANEVARQLRLRDLGGLIVIDFIDMYQRKNQSLLEKEVKQACKNDKARINISKISKFGLLEMSRQRLSPPLKEGAFDRCEACEGAGLVKSNSAIALDVLRKIHEYVATKKVKTLSVEVSNDIASFVLNNKMRFLLALEDKHKVKIIFHAKPGLRHKSFAYTILERSKEEELEPAEKTVQKAKPGEKPQARSQRGKMPPRKKYPRRPAGRRPASSRRPRRKPQEEAKASPAPSSAVPPEVAVSRPEYAADNTESPKPSPVLPKPAPSLPADGPGKKEPALVKDLPAPPSTEEPTHDAG